MADECTSCGLNVGPGSIRFADRSRLAEGALVCADCAAAARRRRRTRRLTDLEAEVGISTRRRVDMGAGAALAHGTHIGR